MNQNNSPRLSSFDAKCLLQRKFLLAALQPPSASSISFLKNHHSNIRNSTSTHSSYSKLLSEAGRRSVTRLHILIKRSQAEEIIMSAPLPGNHGIPRRYVSGLRLQVKPVPWRYASSVHLKMGSTKRSYTEKVFYKMCLVPSGYYEGAQADFCHLPNPGARRYVASMTLQCTNVPIIKLNQIKRESSLEEDSTEA